MSDRSTRLLESLAESLGIKGFFDYQLDCFDSLDSLTNGGSKDLRLCLYYRTGAGKSITALVCLRLVGHTEALVIAPPSTHKQWVEVGKRLGMVITPMSHAKFRMKDTLLKRDQALIADEMHLFGGHQGKGWKKLDRLAAGLRAPLILASATPNYNDAERVYCIQHVLDPNSCRGGFLEFLYTHCETQQNPFSMTPDVTGFKHFKNASEYLQALPGVAYLPDEAIFTIKDVVFQKKNSPNLERYGYSSRGHRMVASGIEKRHLQVNLNLIDDQDKPDQDVLQWIKTILQRTKGKVMIFFTHSSIAEKYHMYLPGSVLITGADSSGQKDSKLDVFKKTSSVRILIGTASLATGTDGLDKVCNTLLIVDDTEDDSLRRQLIGRILPRGEDADYSQKQILRAIFT